MLALSARRCTVSTSQRSCAPSGDPLMRCAPVDHSATCLEMRSEMNAPPNPMIAENHRRFSMLRPFWVRIESTPSRLATIESSSTTARLVATKRKMRFMDGLLSAYLRQDGAQPGDFKLGRDCSLAQKKRRG